MTMRALALCCSLKPSPERSSSQFIANQVIARLGQHGVEGSVIRLADHQVAHSTSADAGDGDEWPLIRRQVLEANIIVVSSPIWNGQPSSYAMKLSERLNAMLSEKDERGLTPLHGKIGIVTVVGNEDGAHHVTAQLSQVLIDLGVTMPASGFVYWVGEALHTVDYQDLPETPKEVEGMLENAVARAVHVARLLAQHPY